MMTLTTIRNRDLTARALRVLSSGKPDPGLIGSTLDEHHALLRDGLHRSTPRIESLISASKKAGALGCKINGSGGGGTILAYAPGRGKEVVEAIGEAGGVPYPAKVSRGANVAAIT
jgi:galactokinase